METIYKIAYNIDNKIQQYMVFIGSSFNNNTPQEIQDKFEKQSHNEIFKQIFDVEELDYIATYNTPVIFSAYNLVIDDTVETIKQKFLLTMRDRESDTRRIAYEEMYLFYQQQQHLDATEIYQKLTKNGALTLTKERLIQFLLNIENIDISTLDDKEDYNYDDILALQLNINTRVIYEPLGQRVSSVENDFPYVVNPFNVIEYSDFLEKYSEDLVTTTNKSILVNTGGMHKNTIFLCCAQDVFAYMARNSLSSEITSQLYFPFLFRQNISSTETLREKYQQLIDNTDAILTEQLQKNIDGVQLFYDIFTNKTEELPYTEIGIKKISIEIHPKYTVQIPLDIIFKILHATQQNPLIKYNPGKRQEKIYRLYANQISTNGKKIPYLNKPAIIKIIKEMDTDRGVHVYIEHYHTSLIDNTTRHKYIVLCSFYRNGIISMHSTLSTALSVAEINTIFHDATVSVMKIVQDYFAQSGYQIAEFNGIEKRNVNIVNMEYTAHIPLTKKLYLRKLPLCLSNIFSIINDDINTGIVMRLKRVSNYNEMDSQEAFIIEKLNGGAREASILRGLVENFGVSEVTAREKLAEFINSMQVIQDAFQQKKFKVKANPGFLMTITKEQFTNIATVVVSGITSTDYLKTIPVYIDTLLRLFEKPDTTTISQEQIKSLCETSKTQLLKKGTVSSDVELPSDAEPLSDAELPSDDDEIAAPIELVGATILQDMAKDLGINVSETTSENIDKPAAPNMLDMLMASDDDTSEDDEDEDEDDEDDYSGGGIYKLDGGDGSDSEDEYPDQDITGMSIANPNPFFKRMQNRDPELFLKESEGKFNAYSRACPWNVRRQPVMLTDEEKAKIDKEHPGSYHEAIKYGSNPEKQYWYICPRYWSLKNNTSLTEEEAKSGKYGSIIPMKAKTVPPGGGVIEFSSKIHMDENGKYIQHYPGFLKPESHPDGLCLPCCFKSWDAPSQVKRRKACSNETTKGRPKLARQKSDIADNYIMGSDKFPLEENRYGYLPLSIQHFLNTDNTQCQINEMDTNLKQDHPCMLRHGVQTSKTQSFIGCLADIWVDRTVSKRLTITEMKEVLIDAMSIDVFMTLQNGDLIDLFTPENSNAQESLEEPDYAISPYTTSKLYDAIDFKNISQKKLFHRVVLSYENFKMYLRDEDVQIDYTYLWDLICKPNEKLFQKGSNLIVLEIPEDDVTDNVNIICPTNHYSNEMFDIKRDTIILLKKQNYFEPIYLFEDKGSEFSVMRRFNSQIASQIPEVIKTLQLIKYSMKNKCGPKNSMPRVYRFKQNIVLDKLLDILTKHEYKIITQIMNVSGRIIGVVAQHKKNKISGIIPCFPSSPVLDIDYVLDEVPYVLSYPQTRQFLKKTSESTQGEIPCQPSIKVIEDKMIIGILTETNQFVVVTPTADTFDDDLPKIEDINYNAVDNTVMTIDSVDEERVKFIKNIKLESNFYRVFRNTVRILLGKNDNIAIRKELEELSKTTTIPYKERLQKSIQLLIKLTENNIKFVEYKPEVLDRINDITSCITKECEDKPYCFSAGTNKCMLLIPDKNIIHQGHNEEMYYGRLADEIIRYTRIKSFIFKPQVFLTFKNVGYDLQENEIIVLQSLLLEEYFDDLVLQTKNPYTIYNTYDTVEPLQTQSYSHIDVLSNYNKYYQQEKVESIKHKLHCEHPQKTKITGKWQQVFAENSQELVFSNEPRQCTFDIILIIIKYHNAKFSNFTIQNLLDILALEYKDLGVKFHNKILLIWKSQGKTAFVKRIQKKETSIEHIIMGDNYYATNLDLWILAQRFNIPLVFYSSTQLLENGKPLLVANNIDNKSFYFIKSTGGLGHNRKVNIPKYRLVVSGSGKVNIPITELPPQIRAEITSEIKKKPLETFIMDFEIDNVKKYAPKKLILKKKT